MFISSHRKGETRPAEKDLGEHVIPARARNDRGGRSARSLLLCCARGVLIQARSSLDRGEGAKTLQNFAVIIYGILRKVNVYFACAINLKFNIWKMMNVQFYVTCFPPEIEASLSAITARLHSEVNL